MDTKIQAYSNNILISCLHGNKVLKKKYNKNENEVIQNNNIYSPKGQMKNNTVGLLFDKRV